MQSTERTRNELNQRSPLLPSTLYALPPPSLPTPHLSVRPPPLILLAWRCQFRHDPLPFSLPLSGRASPVTRRERERVDDCDMVREDISRMTNVIPPPARARSPATGLLGHIGDVEQLFEDASRVLLRPTDRPTLSSSSSSSQKWRCRSRRRPKWHQSLSPPLQTFALRSGGGRQKRPLFAHAHPTATTSQQQEQDQLTAG